MRAAPTQRCVWTVARSVCSEAELEVLTAREWLERHGRDSGYRSVALYLGIPWTTVRDRTKRAEARILRAIGGER